VKKLLEISARSSKFIQQLTAAATDFQNSGNCQHLSSQLGNWKRSFRSLDPFNWDLTEALLNQSLTN
jgi:hypothetical protein